MSESNKRLKCIKNAHTPKPLGWNKKEELKNV